MLPPSQRSSLDFRTAIFNSDIELSVYSFSCFISVRPFVATYAENVHIVCPVDIKKRSFLTSCVFCCFLERYHAVISVFENSCTVV